ncbi:vWA domain-containing protein [Paenibacillus sp. strain BS8-2]
MQFLSAASAWFAAALPVIALMYILKKKYTDTLVPSHLLWNRLLKEQEANRPWQKLRGRLLLLLQLLAALIAVIALMQPVRFGPAIAEGHAVLMIDRSGSMSALVSSSGSERQSRLESVIQSATLWLDQQPSDRPISVVVTGQEPEVIASSERDHAKLREQLNAITPYYGRSDNAAALSFADSLHGNEKDGMTYILTDGEWLDGGEATAIRLGTTAEQWTPATESASPAASDTMFENGSILGLGLREDSQSPGYQFASITVRNDSLRMRTYGIDLFGYSDNGDEVFRTELSLESEAEGWQNVESGQLPPAAYYKAVLRGEPDGIAADNFAYQFPQQKLTGKALLVTDGNMFLEKALLLAGVEVVKSSPELPPPAGELAKGIQYVVVDGYYEKLQVKEGWSEWLKEMPLWIIDHPVEGDPRSVVPSTAEVKKEEHPVVSYLTLQDTHIGRLFTPEESSVAWGDPILRYGGYPAIYAGTLAGQPVLRFTFSLQDTDLPLRPEFPVLIVQASEWMNNSVMPQLGVGVAGETMQIALQSETEQAEWKLVEGATRNGIERDAAAVPLAWEQIGELTRLPALPGLYRLEERSAAGEIIAARLLAVSPDLAELEAIRLADERLKLTAGSIGEAESTSDLQNKRSMEPYSMVALALAMLLVVMLAEWEVYRRGHIS